MQKQANSLIWSAVGGIVGAVAVTALILWPQINVSGSSTSFSVAVGAGAFWGWAIAGIKNWLGRPR